jgi:phenylalanyl-tRNA synthetase beta chain
VAELLVTYGGGTVEPGVTKVGTPPASATVSIPGDLPSRVTGMDIDSATAVRHLLAVGCEVSQQDDRLDVSAPPWRPDLTDPFDLVEEVARLVGYDQVPSVLPPAPPGHGLTPGQAMRRRVGRTLAGAGFAEVISFPFVGQATYDALGLADDDPRRDSLRLANPLSAEAPYLTTTLLPGLLEAGARNAGRGNPDVALFEVATVTLPRGGKAAPILPVDRPPTPEEWEELQAALPEQPLRLAVLLCGEVERSGWWGEGRVATWADAVDAVRQVAEALGVGLTVRQGAGAPWHPGRCAELLVGERSLGHAGELHPQVCRRTGVPPRSAAAEVDLDALLQLAEAPSAPRFSTFPVAKVDVALVVDGGVPAADVHATLAEGAGGLVESIRLFDVYVGEQVGEGRKSLAFALRLRAPDRTLTDEEVAAARDAAVALAGERHGAVLR